MLLLVNILQHACKPHCLCMYTRSAFLGHAMSLYCMHLAVVFAFEKCQQHVVVDVIYKELVILLELTYSPTEQCCHDTIKTFRKRHLVCAQIFDLLSVVYRQRYFSYHLSFITTLTISVLQACCAVTTEYGIPSDIVRKSTVSLKIKISTAQVNFSNRNVIIF